MHDRNSMCTGASKLYSRENHNLNGDGITAMAGILDAATWREVESFLETALELPSNERAHWLAALAHTRPDMARTIAELLDERDRLDARGFLSNPPLRSGDLPASSAGSLAGRSIGAYK